MVNLDLKNRKLLYHLDVNSRQSNRKLGKKVNLSREVTFHRIKKLKEKGHEPIIQYFYTVIDAYKLGYICFRLYLTFKDITFDVKKEVIDYFVKNKHTWLVASTSGSGIDLAVLLWVKSIKDFNKFWRMTMEDIGVLFYKPVFSIYYNLTSYPHTYLFDEEKKRTEYEIKNNKFEITCTEEPIKIKEIDYDILELMATDAKIETIKIAKLTNSCSDTVKDRIEWLKKNKIIQGFRVKFDNVKLGYLHYKVDINLYDFKQRQKVIDYIKYNPYLIMINESAGHADLELEFHVKNVTQLLSIIDKLQKDLPKIKIRELTHFYINNYHKIEYMPPKQIK